MIVLTIFLIGAERLDNRFGGTDLDPSVLLLLIPLALPLLWLHTLIVRRRSRDSKDTPLELPGTTRAFLLRLLDVRLRADSGGESGQIFEQLAARSGGESFARHDFETALHSENVRAFLASFKDPTWSIVLNEVEEEEKLDRERRGCFSCFSCLRRCWCLRRRSAIDDVFDCMDVSRRGTINREDWGRFVTTKAETLLRFAVQSQLAWRRVYWAANTENERAAAERPDAYKPKFGIWRTLCGLRSDFELYKEDLLFYASQNHPVLVLFSRHPNHPMNHQQHIVVELFSLTATSLIATGVTYAMSAPPRPERRAAQLELWALSFLAGQCLIATPSIVLAYLAKLLISWPVLDPAIAGAATQRSSESRYVFIRFLNGSLMTIFVVCFLPLALMLQASDGRLVHFLFFRGISYLEWFPTTIFRKFLPFQVPCLPCMCYRQYGRWWSERSKSLVPDEPRKIGSSYIRRTCEGLLLNVLLSVLGGVCALYVRQRIS